MLRRACVLLLGLLAAPLASSPAGADEGEVIASGHLDFATFGVLWYLIGYPDQFSASVVGLDGATLRTSTTDHAGIGYSTFLRFLAEDGDFLAAECTTTDGSNPIVDVESGPMPHQDTLCTVPATAATAWVYAGYGFDLDVDVILLA